MRPSAMKKHAGKQRMNLRPGGNHGGYSSKLIDEGLKTSFVQANFEEEKANIQKQQPVRKEGT